MELEFTEPWTQGSYEDITWSKGATGSSDTRIVFVRPSVRQGKPLYYNAYCSGSSPCNSSEKGELDLNTGSLTIKKVQLSDEGYYYYFFYIDRGAADTGHKYGIQLEVYGKFFDPGNLPLIQSSIPTTLLCTIWSLFKMLLLDNVLLNKEITCLTRTKLDLFMR